MENPDVMLEVTVNDSTATMSYKVLSKDRVRAATEFKDIIQAIFCDGYEEEDDDFTAQTSG